MPEATNPDDLSAVKAVRSEMVRFPESVFQMGADLDHIDGRLRDLDTQKRLGIGNVLEATPGVWVHLDGFAVSSRMVSNGEYAEFIRYEDEDGRFYDSPELWRHVWTELGFHIDSVQMPYRTTDGEMRFFEESYSACTSFLEAYILSLYYEVQAMFLGLPDERSVTSSGGFGEAGGNRSQTGSVKMPRDRVLKRVFAFVKHKLRGSMASDDEGSVLTDEERKLLDEYQSVQPALDDIDYLVKELMRGYGKQVDPRLMQRFQKGQLIVEPVAFLERLAAAVQADPNLEMPIPVSRVLFPRRWKSHEGQAKKRKLLGKAVDWDVLPVSGVSFFEALAYLTWLSSVSDVALSLPSEAEYERASSWPTTPPPEQGKPVKCDRRLKLLFPWQDHSEKDFNFFFGRDGYEIEGYYQKDQKRYEELLDQTARRVSGKDVIYQLEGFGWHWTCDRYSETELKYSRFADPEYPRYRGAPCFDGPESRTEAFHYEPNQNPKDSFIVLKGSPDVIGGPGLTTRRYAVYPMRGYANVGFRLVSREA